jgi:hypothetical protein
VLIHGKALTFLPLSCLQMGLAMGLIISSGTVALLSQMPGNHFQDYGWRIAFCLR